MQLALRPGLGPAIAAVCFLFGLFGLAAYPLGKHPTAQFSEYVHAWNGPTPQGLELAAECTWPVAETTSSGLVVLSGQLQGVVYIALLSLLPTPLVKDRHLAFVLARQHNMDPVTVH